MGVGPLADVIGLSVRRSPSERVLDYDPAMCDAPDPDHVLKRLTTVDSGCSIS